MTTKTTLIAKKHSPTDKRVLVQIYLSQDELERMRLAMGKSGIFKYTTFTLAAIRSFVEKILKD